MLKKVFFASFLLVTSLASQAGLMSHYGYERDSGSNIVKGGGLEWLKWDVTKGMSINTALSKYASEGWSVATNTQMANLFNAFQFGKSDWYPNQSSAIFTQWTADEQQPHDHFVKLFGETYSNVCESSTSRGCDSIADPYVFSRAIYGDRQVSGKGYWWAYIGLDSTYLSWSIDGDRLLDNRAGLVHNELTIELTSTSDAGVALVRTVPSNPTPVNAPVSFSLFAMGLVVLGIRRRQALGR
jgi:hypothetical protein